MSNLLLTLLDKAGVPIGEPRRQHRGVGGCMSDELDSTLCPSLLVSAACFGARP